LATLKHFIRNTLPILMIVSYILFCTHYAIVFQNIQLKPLI